MRPLCTVILCGPGVPPQLPAGQAAGASEAAMNEGCRAFSLSSPKLALPSPSASSSALWNDANCCSACLPATTCRRLQLRLGQRRRLHQTNEGPQSCTVGGQQGSLDGSQCCGTFQSAEGGRDFICVAVPSPPPPAPSPPPPSPSPPPPSPSPPKPSPPPPTPAPPLPHPPVHKEPPRPSPRPPTNGTRTQR